MIYMQVALDTWRTQKYGAKNWGCPHNKTRLLEELFSFDKDYAVLQLIWQAYQDIIDCYSMADKRRTKTIMRKIVD